jgi:hypothetical protein
MQKYIVYTQKYIVYMQKYIVYTQKYIIYTQKYKPALVVTSIKQSPVLKGHSFLVMS